MVGDIVSLVAAEASRPGRRRVVVLVGFSLGAHIALRSAAWVCRRMSDTLVDDRREVTPLQESLQIAAGSLAGVVAVAPLARIHSDSLPPPWVLTLGRWAARLTPTLPIAQASLGKPYHPDVAAHELQAEQADPHVYTGRVRAASGWAILQSLERLQAEVSALHARDSLPVLLQHGSLDRVCDVRGTRELAGSLGATTSWRASSQSSEGERPHVPSRCYIEYSGAHHDLFRERPVVRDTVIGDMITWIRQQQENRPVRY